MPKDASEQVKRAFANLDHGDEFTAADLRAILDDHARLRAERDAQIAAAAWEMRENAAEYMECLSVGHAKEIRAFPLPDSAALDRLTAERDALLAALDPDQTKGEYIGEVEMTVTDMQEIEGEWMECPRKVTVDWDTIKAVMRMVKARAGLTLKAKR